jgi:hypothetical protein
VNDLNLDFQHRPLAEIASDLARADQRAQERIAAKKTAVQGFDRQIEQETDTLRRLRLEFNAAALALEVAK